MGKDQNNSQKAYGVLLLRERLSQGNLGGFGLKQREKLGRVKRALREERFKTSAES